MKNFEEFRIETEQMNYVRGGGSMSAEEYKKVTDWLWDNGHYDQLAEVMKMVNSGTLVIE